VVWVNWKIFTEGWLQRAERGHRIIDDGDRFISLWIAFNGWMKWKFGEAVKDRTLIDRLKKSEEARIVFEDLRRNKTSFNESLRELSQYTVADMRHLEDQNKVKKYDGSFDSLIEVLYQVRCDLFHGRKDINEDKKDIELVSLAYRILLPLFKTYLSI
jgi:hypothetical protein